MDEMQQAILTICNHIAKIRGWDLTVSFDVETLGVDFTCHSSNQKNCFFSISDAESELTITTLFSNLLDLKFGTIVNVPNGDLTKEKLN